MVDEKTRTNATKQRTKVFGSKLIGETQTGSLTSNFDWRFFYESD